MANKRAEIEYAFDYFHIQTVASYKEDKIQDLLTNDQIIRHEPKIRAIIHNANQVLLIQKNIKVLLIFCGTLITMSH